MGKEKAECRQEVFCRHDKSHKECCTTDYDTYMQWFDGPDFTDFECPDEKVTNTSKFLYKNRNAKIVLRLIIGI